MSDSLHKDAYQSVVQWYAKRLDINKLHSIYAFGVMEI